MGTDRRNSQTLILRPASLWEASLPEAAFRRRPFAKVVPQANISLVDGLTIIDSHTHCYPPELATDPRRWAEDRGERHWADLVAPLDRPSIQGWATPEQMLSAMDAAGVRQAVLLGWYWETEATCRWHNEAIAEWVRAAPERFVGFAAILPSSAAAVRSQIRDAAQLGLRGVGELHPDVQAFDATTPGWRTLADCCEERGWPVNLHATEVAGIEHPGNRPTQLNDFVQMARQNRSLSLILAHWGGGLPFFELNPRLRPILRNVLYDTAAGPLLYDPRIFRTAVDLVGPSKILFGSDYPLRLFPRDQKIPDLSRYVEGIRDAAGLDDGELRAIFRDNARRLLGS